MDRVDDFLEKWAVRRASPVAYLFAVAGVGAALAVGLGLRDAFGGLPLTLLCLVAAAATLLGGLRPGLVATALGASAALLADDRASPPALLLRQLLLYLTVAGALCLLIALLRTSVQRLHRRRGQAGRHVAELEQLLSTQKLLLREADHRIKNSLQLVASLLRIQGRHLADDHLREQFAAAVGRVETIGRVHQILQRSENQAEVELGRYLEDLCREIAASFSADATSCPVRAETILVPSKSVISIGLMVNELVTNAFKHGYRGRTAGPVEVVLRRRSDGRVTIVVEDRGGGLPDGFDIAAGGLGMSLLRSLLPEFDGDIAATRRDAGTAFTLNLRL